MSDDYVLDASALALALIGKTDAADDLRRRLPTMRRHAPHLVDAEVGNVLRRHERRGQISAREGEVALAASRTLIEHRYPHSGVLAELAWSWRSNLTFYDALYVALAVRLGVPLLTADARLARAPGLACPLEMV
ncbi:type II toxin-antitoxin system VapC family toxin [Intrasporangium sp.]|uniref:type II toxin-antitoxin system VapC family toxin n=1 Tax=Intrasporangium sp. TaxID=1925024 RepID=UPI0032217783